MKGAAEHCIHGRCRVADAKDRDEGLLEEWGGFTRLDLSFINAEQGRFNILAFGKFLAIKDDFGDR